MGTAAGYFSTRQHTTPVVPQSTRLCHRTPSVIDALFNCEVSIVCRSMYSQMNGRQEKAASPSTVHLFAFGWCISPKRRPLIRRRLREDEDGMGWGRVVWDSIASSAAAAVRAVDADKPKRSRQSVDRHRNDRLRAQFSSPAQQAIAWRHLASDAVGVPRNYRARLW